MIIGLLIIFSLNTYSSQISSSPNTNKSLNKTNEPKFCHYWLPLFKPLCHHLYQTWTEGNNELYLSGYAWHNRFTYSPERLREKKYNELAWGGGFGKGFFDEKGNWHGLYAFIFLDSHRHVEPIAGYAYLITAHLTQNFKAGLGISVFLTARPEYFHNAPFPGAAPWAGLFYKKVSLKAAYVPGSSTTGNVLYLVGTYAFDK